MVFRFIKGIVKFVLYIAFVAVLVIYTPRILSNVLDTEYPMATITSSSMWPQLKQDDLILVKGVSGADVEVGQIIIFRNSKGFTIHRLVRREDDPDAPDRAGGKLITKGDANSVEDQPILEEDVIGRVVYIQDNPFRIPKAGLIARNLGPKINQNNN